MNVSRVVSLAAALVITATEAVHGQPDDLTSRQRELVARAYALLQAAIDN